jgi:hypothetical protein
MTLAELKPKLAQNPELNVREIKARIEQWCDDVCEAVLPS